MKLAPDQDNYYYDSDRCLKVAVNIANSTCLLGDILYSKKARNYQVLIDTLRTRIILSDFSIISLKIHYFLLLLSSQNTPNKMFLIGRNYNFLISLKASRICISDFSIISLKIHYLLLLLSSSQNTPYKRFLIRRNYFLISL